MTTYYDEQGNAVEAFSKEELEAQLAEKIKAVIPPAPDLSPVLDRLQKTESALYDMRVEKLADSYAGSDADKRQMFISKFGRLTGYEETVDGMAERARDAAKLAFDSVNTGASTAGITNVGGKSVDAEQNTGAQASSADIELRKALGITEEDVSKYGKTQ